MYVLNPDEGRLSTGACDQRTETGADSEERQRQRGKEKRERWRDNNQGLVAACVQMHKSSLHFDLVHDKSQGKI